jgi:hypothetical protein
MPLPNSALTHAEIQVHGLVSANGVQSKNALFTFHYRRTASSGALTELALDTIFQSNVAAPLFLALNNRITQKFNTVRFMDDPTRLFTQVSHALVGNVAGDSMPTANGVYILYRTALRGKRYRGSNRFWPISEADTTAGTADILNAASLALWATFIAAYMTPLTDANGQVWVPCVYSRAGSLPQQLPQAQIVTNDITTALIDKTVRQWKRHKQAAAY